MLASCYRNSQGTNSGCSTHLSLYFLCCNWTLGVLPIPGCPFLCLQARGFLDGSVVTSHEPYMRRSSHMHALSANFDRHAADAFHAHWAPFARDMQLTLHPPTHKVRCAVHAVPRWAGLCMLSCAC